jgi:hypothetical protein
LSFELQAPFSRLLSARWDQIFENRWYPFGPEERKYWHLLCDRIDMPAYKILERVHKYGNSDFGGSDYWFPSQTSSQGHIKNPDRVWRSILKEIAWPFVPIRLISSHYLNLPNFDRPRFNQKWQDEQNQIAAKLSTISGICDLTH